MDPDPRLVCKWFLSLRVDVAPVILSILTHASLGGVVGDYQFRIDPVFKPALVSGEETSLRSRDPIFAPSVYDSMLGATLDVLGPPMHAEIAGAGFAGLAAAIALQRRGWSVVVHEKEPELRAFGAGIFIWENGQRVLQAIGAYPDVAHGAHQAPGYETRRTAFVSASRRSMEAIRFC